MVTKKNENPEAVTVPANFTPDLIGQLITAGVEQAAKKANNDLPVKDVGKVATVVKKEVVPVVANATNQEPWYQSRVIIGTAVSMVFMGMRLVGVQTDVISEGEVVELVMTGVALAGAAFALYGRLKAGLKPLGE